MQEEILVVCCALDTGIASIADGHRGRQMAPMGSMKRHRNGQKAKDKCEHCQTPHLKVALLRVLMAETLRTHIPLCRRIWGRCIAGKSEAPHPKGIRINVCMEEYVQSGDIPLL